jgi:hypothetical protein
VREGVGQGSNVAAEHRHYSKLVDLMVYDEWNEAGREERGEEQDAFKWRGVAYSCSSACCRRIFWISPNLKSFILATTCPSPLDAKSSASGGGTSPEQERTTADRLP